MVGVKSPSLSQTSNSASGCWLLNQLVWMYYLGGTFRLSCPNPLESPPTCVPSQNSHRVRLPYLRGTGRVYGTGYAEKVDRQVDAENIIGNIIYFFVFIYKGTQNIRRDRSINLSSYLRTLGTKYIGQQVFVSSVGS